MFDSFMTYVLAYAAFSIIATVLACWFFSGAKGSD